MFVLKFGGASVANIDKIKQCAQIISERKNESLVVVVSAMQGVTDQLCRFIQEINSHAEDSECDVIKSSGEQITAGLLALALKQLNIASQSYLGWQIPLITDDEHSHASILSIDTTLLQENISQGIIPIVAGFQGITRSKRLTTLGRGGSDITAVALACALFAKRCDIYKAVNGIYTKDPHTHHNATQYDALSYEEMLVLIRQDGAKVLNETAVCLAQQYCLPIYVRSSFSESKGTMVGEKAHAAP